MKSQKPTAAPVQPKKNLEVVHGCETCPMSALNGWREKVAWLRMELRRHKVTDTERRLAEAILDTSYAWGRETVMVPELKFFCSLTGMEKPHVHEAIAGLHLQRIISVRTLKGQIHYSVRLDTESWKVTPRELMQDMGDRLNQLRAINDLPPFTTESKSFFKPHADTIFLGGGVTDSVISDVITQFHSSDEKLPNLH